LFNRKRAQKEDLSKRRGEKKEKEIKKKGGVQGGRGAAERVY